MSAPFFILLLPFFMFHQVMPFVSDRSFGFEYPLFAIEKQMELMFSIKTGSYPLFAPGFYGGLSSAGLSMGESIHPISHIAAVLPGYWDGRALELNTLLRLFSLGLAHLALFLFLRRLKLNVLPAFLVSLATAYNMCMLVLFYYGCSMETWTGFLFLVAAVGALCMNPHAWRHTMAVAGATFWIIGSGHPQIMYFVLPGSGFIAVLMPAYLRQVAGISTVHSPAGGVAPYHKRLLLGVFAGVTLSAPYWLPFYVEIVAVNVGRVGQDYAWSLIGTDTLPGTLNNFFNPFRSGSSLFGGSPLFLVAALIPMLLLAGVRPPKVIWILWIAAFLVFLYLQGPRTPVHYFFWKYAPLAGSFRIAGRMAVVLPVFFMLLAVWLLNPKRSSRGPTPLTIAAGSALVLTTGYLFLPVSMITDPDAIWLVNEMSISMGMERLHLLLGMAILTAVILGGRGKQARTVIGFAAAVLLSLIQLKCLLHTCAHTVRDIRTPTFDEMLLEKQERLAYRPYPGPGMGNRAIMRQLEESFLEPFLGKVYFHHRIVGNADEAYRAMKTGRSPDMVVIEDAHGRLPPAPSREVRSSNDAARVFLAFSSFNRLVFHVHAAHPAFFGMAYPFTGHWEASIDGTLVHAYPANGAAHAIELPSGDSRVEFRYKSPSTLVGVFTGCLAFVFLTGMTALAVLPTGKGRRIALAAVVIGVAGFVWWRQGLYHGDHLGTHYAWTSPPADAPVNRAYAASVRTSSRYPVFPELYAGSRAVDGDRTPGTGFITDLEPDPWVLVDLGRSHDIEFIRIYESRSGPRPIELHRPDDPALTALFGYTWNLRPLTISISADGNRWTSHAVAAEPDDSPIEWRIPEWNAIRYILVQASGVCRLSIEEIEAYERR